MSATSGVELLEAVRAFLQQEIFPELTGFKAYQTRVAANSLAIVMRELELGTGLEQLDAEMAATLGLMTEPGPVSRQIALGLRDGSLTVDEPLLKYLRQRTVLAVAIDNPKYSGLQQARALWPD